MNRRLRPCAAALALLLTGHAVGAQVPEPESLDRIRTIASAAVSAQASASARVDADTLDPRLRLPACTSAPVADPPTLRGPVATVAVHCAAPTRWSVHVPVRIRDLRPVLVLRRPVRAGELADDSLFDTQARDIAALPFGHLEDPASVRGRQFRRALPGGAAPVPGDLVAPRWVQRGQTVQLRSRSGGIEVRAEGTALADGAAGHRVRVENRGSRRIVEGTVSAPGVVEVVL